MERWQHASCLQAQGGSPSLETCTSSVHCLITHSISYLSSMDLSCISSLAPFPLWSSLPARWFGSSSKTMTSILSSRPALYAAKKLTCGFTDMAFAPYGEHWKQARKVAVSELLSARRVQSFRVTREEEVVMLIASIQRLSSSSRPPVPINLSEMLLSLSNNVTCRAALGERFGSSNYEKDGSRLFHILEETQRLLGGFCTADFFPWLEWIHRLTGLQARLERNFKELDEFYDQVIEDHLKTVEWSHPGDEDLVHVLLRLQKDPSHGSINESTNHIKGLLTVMMPSLSLSLRHLFNRLDYVPVRLVCRLQTPAVISLYTDSKFSGGLFFYYQPGRTLDLQTTTEWITTSCYSLSCLNGLTDYSYNHLWLQLLNGLTNYCYNYLRL